MQLLLGLLGPWTVWVTQIWIDVLVVSYAVAYGTIDARRGNEAFSIASILNSLTLASSAVLLAGGFDCEVSKVLCGIKP